MFKEFLILSTLIAICSSNSFNYFKNSNFKNFTDVDTTCTSIRKNEIAFTGECYLKNTNISSNLDKVKKYVKLQSDNLSIEDLLNDGFKDSTKYFQDTYENFKTQYKGINKIR
jgi:hypothetical protein